MAFFQALAFVSALSTVVQAGYTIQDDYTANAGTNFFDMFTFFDGDDYTHGFVDYQSRDGAQSAGLISTGNQVFIGVDNTTIVPSGSRGRKSVRLSSNTLYDHNTLVVSDMAHMPGGYCGGWPALWMSSENWPTDGEIDIVEEITSSNSNQMSLHTSSSTGACSADPGAAMTGNPDRFPDCTQEGDGGCDVNDPRQNSFGAGFNQNGGGVYAMEWTPYLIRVFFWPRDQVPSADNGPIGENPDPNTWGTPAAAFQGSDCQWDSHFKRQHLVIDQTFCGDWPGNDNGAWQGYTGCSASTGVDQCTDYVAQNPEAFSEGYWSFNSLKVWNRKDCEYDC